MRLDQKGLLGSPLNLAINSAHGVAFHRGLGAPTNATSSSPFQKYLDAQAIADFSDAAYARNNIAVVANGADHTEFAKWVKEFFGDTKAGSKDFKIQSEKSQYFGGEERIAHGSGNVMIIGFPGSSSFTSGQSFKPEISVLAALLGGESSIKWSPGFSLLSKAASTFPGAHVSTQNAAYTDAGLLYVTITGKSGDVSKASKAVVDALKAVASGNISDEDIQKATALAKYRALELGQQTEAGLEATGMGLISNSKAYQIDEVGKRISEVKADQVKNVSTLRIIEVFCTDQDDRLRSHYSSKRLLSLRSVIYSHCKSYFPVNITQCTNRAVGHGQRRSVSRYRCHSELSLNLSSGSCGGVHRKLYKINSLTNFTQKLKPRFAHVTISGMLYELNHYLDLPPCWIISRIHCIHMAIVFIWAR